MAIVSSSPAPRALRLDAERSRLVESHVSLAEKIARRRCFWGWEDPEETRSDALWGLMLAGQNFKPDRGSFTSYAAICIEGAIRRGRQVRSGVPRTMWEQGDRPKLVSLNAPVGEDGTELLDTLPAPCEAEANMLADALRGLAARERLVLTLRYYHGRPQADIASIIGRSQMQVSRIERAALRKLRALVGDVVLYSDGAPDVALAGTPPV